MTPAIVFVATGLILGVQSTGLLPDAIRGGTVAVELTLAVLLFADASTVRLVDAEADARVPIRLLLIGLPLTIVIGTLLAKAVYPTSGWATAALIATILSPTDSALGLAVYTNTAVPVRIRRSLNLESGLNDGLVTPFFTLFLAVVVSEDHVGPNNWALQAGKEIGLAVVAAVVIGGLGGWMLTLARPPGLDVASFRAARDLVACSAQLCGLGRNRRERLRRSLWSGHRLRADHRRRDAQARGIHRNRRPGRFLRRLAPLRGAARTPRPHPQLPSARHRLCRAQLDCRPHASRRSEPARSQVPTTTRSCSWDGSVHAAWPRSCSR